MNKKKIKHFKCNHTACILHSFSLQEYCFSGPGWIFPFFFRFCFIFSVKKKTKLIIITSRCLSNFIGPIVWYFSAALSCEQRPFFLVTGLFSKNIVVLRDREEWSPETWPKACKNEQHIGSIKDLRPQKISNLLTFKPQMNMPQNVGSIKDLTSKNIHWVDTLNSAKLIVLREN